MRNFTISLALTFIVVSVLAGCEPDNRGIKVAPKMGPDPKGAITYEDDYYDDHYVDEYNRTGDEQPDEFELLTVYFDYDKFQLTQEALDIMSGNAGQLMNNPIKLILIEGHCDERGTEEYNLALGEKRAQEVREYLVKYGIAPDRLSIVSYGESMPADHGHGERAWAKNRRAEFAVLSR